jgi:tRNA isopentenyl-2-thiomethyl-A-37 hydroxylase MiaE
MGYSISNDLHQKLERNRSEGRLCGGAVRSGPGCSRRAILKVYTDEDIAGKTYGPTKLCKRHSYDDYAQLGYQYANGPIVRKREVF